VNAFENYISIGVGLLIGALAHFGFHLSSGTMPSGKAVLGFLMQLALIGLLAVVANKQLTITDSDMRALTTAVLAISAQEVIRYIKKNGWQRVVYTTLPPVDTVEGELRQVEQKARAIRALEESGRLPEAVERINQSRQNEDK